MPQHFRRTISVTSQELKVSLLATFCTLLKRLRGLLVIRDLSHFRFRPITKIYPRQNSVITCQSFMCLQHPCISVVFLRVMTQCRHLSVFITIENSNVNIHVLLSLHILFVIYTKTFQELRISHLVI